MYLSLHLSHKVLKMEYDGHNSGQNKNPHRFK